MDFIQYKIVNENEDLVLYLYLDDPGEFAKEFHQEALLSPDYQEEFSNELLELRGERSFRSDVRTFIYKKFPNSKITTVKLVVGNFPIGGFSLTEMPKSASAYSPSESILCDTEGPTDLTIDPLLEVDSANQTKYTISGKTEPNATVSISLTDGNNTLQQDIHANQEGHFTQKIDFSNLNDGFITMNAVTKDSNGNPGKSMDAEIQKDSTAPSGLSVDIGEKAVINKGNVNTFAVFGKGDEDGAIVHIRLTDGFHQVNETGTVRDGIYNVPINTSTLKDGLIQLRVYQEDEAGNDSAPITMNLNKDTAVSAPTIQTSNVKNTGTGYIYTLKGKAEPHAQLLVTVSGETGTGESQAKWTADDQGNFSGDIDISTYINNHPYISVHQVDQSGNTSDYLPVDVLSYTIGSGDTLWKVALLFNTTTADLMTKNQLLSPTLIVGQTLKIPQQVSGSSCFCITKSQEIQNRNP